MGTLILKRIQLELKDVNVFFYLFIYLFYIAVVLTVLERGP